MPGPSRVYLRCNGCKRRIRIDLIDGKEDFTTGEVTLLCRHCYGQGWSPLQVEWLAINDPPHIFQE
jgi:hypothetical protein